MIFFAWIAGVALCLLDVVAFGAALKRLPPRRMDPWRNFYLFMPGGGFVAWLRTRRRRRLRPGIHVVAQCENCGASAYAADEIGHDPRCYVEHVNR